MCFSADVLGHPFGKVPSPRPFDGSVEDSEVILSDPCNPLGKEMLTGRNMQLHVQHYTLTHHCVLKMSALVLASKSLEHATTCMCILYD